MNLYQSSIKALSKLYQSSIKARGNGKVCGLQKKKTNLDTLHLYTLSVSAAIFSCPSSSTDITTGLFGSPRWPAFYAETQREALRDNAEVPGSTPAGQDIIVSALRSLSQ
jgi:hypothetical protein